MANSTKSKVETKEKEALKKESAAEEVLGEETKDSAKEADKEKEAKTEEVDKESEKSGAEAEDTESKGSAKKDKKDELIEELNDRIKRQMAEFENFRNRSAKEKAGMYDMGAISVLEKMLPVVDNFERGLESADDGPFAEGMKMIYKQLMTSFEEMGVTIIPALGETFDPDVHNAVMHEDDPDKGENEITMELQKGYKYHDAVVRHSMVKVAN